MGKNRSFNIKAQLLTMSILPAIIIGIAVLVTGISFMKNGMEEEILKGLLSSAYAYRDTGVQNANRKAGDNSIEEQLKKETGYDFTWFDGDTRKNSSLGSSVIGTKAVPAVISEVINQQHKFTSTNTQVAGKEYFVAYVPVKDKNGKVVAMAFTGVSRESVNAQINKSIKVMLGIVIALIVATVLVSIYVATRMSGAVLSIQEGIMHLASGEFVKADKHLDRSDEIGQALNSTNNLVDKITGVVGNISQASETVGKQAKDLASTSNQISETTDGVSTAIQQIAKGATEQADNIQSAMENLNALSSAIQEVSDKSKELADTASNMDEASQASVGAMRDLSKNMSEMEESVNHITKTMNDTNDAVKKVNKRVEGIIGIADQTKLLALNASIEAARAGEAGKGFTVVAQEIGKLAEQSANTADEIKSEMDNLLKQASEATEKTQDVSKIRQSVSNVLNETMGKIEDLIENVGSTVNGVNTISEITQKCEASRTVIVDAMGSLSAISEENAASSEETSASMEELNATVNMLASAANDLNDVSVRLDNELKFFKV